MVRRRIGKAHFFLLRSNRERRLSLAEAKDTSAASALRPLRRRKVTEEETAVEEVPEVVIEGGEFVLEVREEHAELIVRVALHKEAVREEARR
jgi:hypothetical protein